MLSRSTGATGQAAGRQSGAGRARLGRQARRLYLAVRGAGLDARSANALCGGGAHDRRKLAPGACHLPPQYTGVSNPLGLSNNNAFGRIWPANAPFGDNGVGSSTILDPTGLPLAGAPNSSIGGDRSMRAA